MTILWDLNLNLAISPNDFRPRLLHHEREATWGMTGEADALHRGQPQSDLKADISSQQILAKLH